MILSERIDQDEQHIRLVGAVGAWQTDGCYGRTRNPDDGHAAQDGTDEAMHGAVSTQDDASQDRGYSTRDEEEDLLVDWRGQTGTRPHRPGVARAMARSPVTHGQITRSIHRVKMVPSAQRLADS